VVQFAFLVFVAGVNLSVGVGTAVYLGKAPRDIRFLWELLDALALHTPFAGRGVADTTPHEAPVERSPVADRPVVETKPLPRVDAPTAKDRKVYKAAEKGEDESAPALGTPPPPAPEPESREDDYLTSVGLEEMVIDMAAREVHLRRNGQRATGDHGDTFDWEGLLANVADDIQKLLRQFNEARHLIGLDQKVATDANQICLREMDAYWNAINKQSLQLLTLSTAADPPDSERLELAAICEGVLTACQGTRESCAKYLASVPIKIRR